MTEIKLHIMNTEFGLVERREDGVVILDVSGELDALVAPQLKDKITQDMEDGETKFIINFEEVVHINSLALGILRGKLKSTREEGGDIKLINLSEHIKSIFEMIGLDEIFEIYETEEEAIESFK